MTLGTSLFLIAVGAILRFAVSVTTSGFSIHTIGVILMIVGAVGVVLSFLWLAIWSDRRRQRTVEGVPVERRPTRRERETF